MKSEYPWRQPIHSQNVRRLYDSITNEIKMQVSNPYIASTLLNWDVDIQNEIESLPHHIELHRSTNTIFKEGEFGVYIAEVKVERRPACLCCISVCYPTPDFMEVSEWVWSSCGSIHISVYCDMVIIINI